MTKTTVTVLLSALCFAPILTACVPPDESEAEDNVAHPRPMLGGEGLEFTAPEADPVEIYGDDAPGPGGGDPPEPKLPDLAIDQNFSVFPAGGYWYCWRADPLSALGPSFILAPWRSRRRPPRASRTVLSTMTSGWRSSRRWYDRVW